MPPTIEDQYRALLEHHKTFLSFLESLGQSRELSLAKTKIDEAKMWAKEHLLRDAAGL